RNAKLPGRSRPPPECDDANGSASSEIRQRHQIRPPGRRAGARLGTPGSRAQHQHRGNQNNRHPHRHAPFAIEVSRAQIRTRSARARVLNTRCQRHRVSTSRIGFVPPGAGRRSAPRVSRTEDTMGLLTFSINVTLDGCGDHQEAIADDETHAFFTRLMDESGAMLWGRVTYEMMESYWPAVARGEAEAPPAMREWAVKLDAKPKYVVSS